MSVSDRLRSAGSFLASRLRRLVPDPFVFALVLTLGVGILAWSLTASSAGQVLDAWYQGFWILLEFGMQIVLILATGYAIALSPLAARGIDCLARRVKRPSQVYLAVMVAGPLLTLVSWGWVVLTAVLAREMAARVKGIDYAYLTACVFVSSWSWVCGLSSTIPLMLSTDGNFLVEIGLLQETVGVEHTLGSGLNLLYFAVFMVVIPATMVLSRPRAAEVKPLEEMREATATQPSVIEEAESTRLPGNAPSDRLGHGRWLTGAVAFAGLAYLARHFARQGFDLDLNVMIFAFLMVGVALHQSPMRYVVAMRRACADISGIIFQYPFYAGIMGLMMYTGLGAAAAEVMAAQASPATLPAFAQLVGATVNFAIPSAGGEWAVVGPGLLETANLMATELSPGEHRELVARIALAVAYGETSSNLIQPFFLLVIMPVMGAGVRIQARDVMGHMAPPFVVFYVITLGLVTWAPM